MYSGSKDELMEKFVLVKGGPSQLSETLKSQIIGLRQHASGFEGLMPAQQAKNLAAGLVTERPSLDEIVVFMNDGGEVK